MVEAKVSASEPYRPDVGVCPVCLGADEVLLATEGSIRLVKCRECHVRHVWPIPSPAEISARFDQYYAGRLDLEQEIFEKNRKGVLSRIARFIRKRRNSGSILDVGCGNGYFLDTFFRSPEWSRFGVEMYAETAAEAEAKGIRVTTGHLAASHLPGSSFDVVVVLDTFFYFPDPRAAAREIWRVLRPGGIAIVESPLAASRLFRLSHNPDRLDLFYYSPSCLIRLLREAGFNIDEVVPLSASRQANLLRRVLYGCYGTVTKLIWWLSLGRLVVTPRFAVAASKA